MNTNTHTSIPATIPEHSKQGARIRHPRIAGTIEECQRTSLDHKLLYLRANTEARAIVDRYRRHQATSREAKKARLQTQVSELIRERLDAGFEGISAREAWQHLDSELKAARHTYRQVAQTIAANDPA